MHTKNHQVPFRITDINLGFEEAEGWMRLEKNRIVFEYQIKDALGILVKSDLTEMHLSFEDLEYLEIRDWWVTLRLILTVKSIRAIRALPNSHSGELKIKIPTRYRRELRRFVKAARHDLSEYRIRNKRG